MRYESSVHPRPQDFFGDRFAFYARRVQTLFFESQWGYFPHYQGFISPQVLNTWADAAQQLFPLLHAITVGLGYASSVLDARVVLCFLTPNIDDFYMICPKLFFLDPDETAQLKISGTGLQSLRFGALTGDQQSAQLLASTVISALTRYEIVHLSLPLTSSAITHLGQCPRLRNLKLKLVGPVLWDLSIGAFGALTQLELHDSTSELTGMHFTLALPSHIRLQSFSYTMGYLAPFLNRLSLHRFVQHITTWVTLTSIFLSLHLEDGASSLEAYREIHTHFHTLPHLETLKWRSNTPLILDNTILRDFLSACPQLAEWHIFNVDAVEVSLPAFVSLLSTHPNIRCLPVRVCCNQMPSPEAVANCGASRYMGPLSVIDVEDPDAVAVVLRRMAPYVTTCSFDSVQGVQAMRIVQLNKLLQ
jgi:hypothetical protein